MAAREEAELQAAIQGQDAAAIGRLVVQGTSTRLRQLAAQAIEDPGQLRQLIRDVRGGNDKSVYKILTSKRDALLAEARRREQLQAEIGAAAAAIERHSQRPHDPLFAPTLEQLESRWTSVGADAEPDVMQKVQRAIDRSREVIAQHLRQIALEASRELAAANAAATAQRARELEQKAAALDAAEQAGIRQAEREAERKAQAEKQQAVALALGEIGGLVRRAHSALAGGSTGRAAGLRGMIEEKLPGAPPLPPHLANQLQQLDVKLDELKDWKSFSVAPKRAELMEEMESLVGATLEPTALAERIKGLQQEWRTLSKGAGENLETDWQRFQEAAQKAYLPCQEYFAAQAQVRQENLRLRAALLDRLAAFEAGHDWQQPDWRTVLIALRESKQEWRQHSPVDRAPGNALQTRFNALTASLQGRLDAEYAGNIKQKESLIERARQLHASADSRQGSDALKDLQQQWKAVGLVPRDVDNRLWEEFRRQCELVFQKRQQEFAGYTAELEANQSKALALCDELAQVAARSGPELLTGAEKLPELRLAFEAIGEFPRGAARDLRSKFESAFARCEKAVAQQQARAAEHSWTELFDAANRVRACRLALARTTDLEEHGVLRRAAEGHLASVSQWPKGGLLALESQLAKEGDTDVGANEVALRRLCIRAEILTERPTPPEDQPLRREYQVQRLMQSMGQGIGGDESQLDSLALEWVGVGPTDEAVYLQLLERFRRCRPH